MSYVRFGPDSDVYVFMDAVSGKLECCACQLFERFTRSVRFRTRTQMLEHLREHRRAGHKVPARASIRLGRELARRRRRPLKYT